MKNKMMKVLPVVCALVLLAAAVQWLPMARAEQYQVGDAEITAPVKNLEIDWTSGKVRIAYHSGNSVKISEKADGRLSEDRRMRWTLDGDTLKIQYEKPGFHLFSFISPKKELTVALPEELALRDVRIATTSADMDIPALRADSLQLNTTSGDIRAAVNAGSIKSKLTSGNIELQVMNTAEEIEIGSTSGSITLQAPGARDKIKLNSTSGAIRATAGQTDQFKAASTSSDIHAVIGEAKKTEIKSTSGKVIVEIGRMEEVDIRTVSGGVTVYLPEKPGFTARVETVSGHIENKLPLAKQGKDFLSGDGSGTVEIRTTSGDIMIDKYSE